VKKILIVLIPILVLLGLYFFTLSSFVKIGSDNINSSQESKSNDPVAKNQTMKITSPAFENNQKIPSVNSCDGKGVNPPLVFEDVPENAKSLALIVEDPDAPGGTFIHWVVFNIDPKVRKIDEGSVPSGAVEGVTSSGIGFVPPCPPSGTHRYIFKLFALDNTLNLQKGASKEEVEQAMQGHTIEQTELIGLYGRG